MPQTAKVAQTVEPAAPQTRVTDTAQENASLLEHAQFQARMSSLNIPLDGTPHSINTVVQRIEAGGQHPLQKHEDFMYLQRTIGNQAVIQLLDRMENTGNEKQEDHTCAKDNVQTKPLKGYNATRLIQQQQSNHNTLSGTSQYKPTPTAITLSPITLSTTRKNPVDKQAKNINSDLNNEAQIEVITAPVQKMATANNQDGNNDGDGNDDNKPSHNNSASVQRLSHSSTEQTAAIHKTAAAEVQGAGIYLPVQGKCSGSCGVCETCKSQANSKMKPEAIPDDIQAKLTSTWPHDVGLSQRKVTIPVKAKEPSKQRGQEVLQGYRMNVPDMPLCGKTLTHVDIEAPRWRDLVPCVAEGVPVFRTNIVGRQVTPGVTTGKGKQIFNLHIGVYRDPNTQRWCGIIDDSKQCITPTRCQPKVCLPTPKEVLDKVLEFLKILLIAAGITIVIVLLIIAIIKSGGLVLAPLLAI
ncbi:MAG: hypothetical protein V3T17_07690 [Pseudomonadales bacterium]